MIPEKIGVYVGSKIPNILRLSIEKAVKTGRYLNVSELVRDARKEKRDREGFLYSAGRNEGILVEA